MAKHENDSFTKRSSKFDNFLKRNLDDDTFSRIRAYEACIVCSNKENKAFKFVVLTDECLYLTENPPKTITTAVLLQDIFGIDLIDDLPDFLSGQEQLNTTHIEINYWTDIEERVKPSSKSAAQNFESTAASINHAETPHSVNNHDKISLSHSMPETTLQSQLRESRNNYSSQSLKALTVTSQNKNDMSSSFRLLPFPPNQNVDSLAAGDQKQSQIPSPRTRNKLNKRSPAESPSVAQQSDVIEIGDKTKTKMKLHLYMLTPHSKMLLLIKSAVNNHLTRATLSVDQDYAQKMAVKGKCSFEKVEQLFSGLIKDLTNPSNTMEKNFEFILELKTAAEKYFLLKKLFWKTDQLFSLFIQILKEYLPKSPVNVNIDSGRARRADEFELVILVLQTLNLMLRETEIFPSRLRVLYQQGGGLVCDLVEILTCFPELPTRYVPPTTKASKLLMQTEADKWKCLSDSEIHELFMEFSSISTSVLFELLVIAQQSHWGKRETSFFNIGWLISKLEVIDTIEKFLERIIVLAMRHIQPSKRMELSPQETVLVFQLFFVLQLIMLHSPKLASFIRNNYSEEFKYYIHGPTLKAKLPDHYPISSRTMLLIEEVMNEVLQKKVRLLLASDYSQS